ncbi:TSUP family transporter [Mycobacterium bourgelatii]|uniref:Probable membrane transporter protein n=1 Tax=Mycobacterium bourgelatii TaxID=1273442 RepID=A0A7I9YXN2_MYCBU|nr:TSUP family transporter [Mycobacterium bourgelatii]MCV6972983.1 sulfite exporter TauE/SafE family protein [Mycobacterium bourgelatii]GFG93489.1 anion permease [Mycobacterium bourgelatii]
MDDPVTLLTSAIAGLILAMVTTPVGVSGAVFLLPVQLTLLGVPNPAVTPTNLLFNIVSTPGALIRYRRSANPAGPLLTNPLTKVLVAGTVPGVVFGSLVRVFLIPGPRLFRFVVAALLLPLGLWLCAKSLIRSPVKRDPVVPSSWVIGALALGVGVVGGVYGIGGGSLLSPILVGRGLPTRLVAPAALTTTFVTSIVGAAAYSLIALASPGQHIAPVWAVGLLAGLGGLIGGYLGARLQPRAPETVLRTLLGALAVASALLYVWQALRM